ncbi:MAG TPA: 4-hydroxybenzoate octaprenyltransferase [Alphaproteobacteria bacterium]|jgi:4-hydroxybenzoate polyprenyltransferase
MEAARNTNGLIAGTDMPAQGWVDRVLPAAIRPYAKLMRLDRPIGTWLLLWPCWWSLVWALDTAPATARDWLHFAWLYLLFGVGAMVMRGAGCTYNDIVDRDFDAKVERTRTRPIPSGQVSVRRAIAFMALQLLVGLAILLQLNWFAVALGAASLLLVFTYPLMKRITYWPQFVLGLAFNWGALLGWAAVAGSLSWAPALLYAGGIAWTLGYDTIYAHQDKEDDILVGVKSTALKLGGNTRPWLAGFYTAAVALFAAAGVADGLGWPFYAALAVGALQLAWQAADVDLDDAADCLVKFKSNRYFGWILVAGLFADLLLRR